MSTKSEVLKILENNKNKAISGNDIAKTLNITRTSIWKAINELKQEGYMIDSSTKKGYIFSGNNNKLSLEGVEGLLNKKLGDFRVVYKKETESTNKDLLELADKGERNLIVEIAEKQTSGRGRIGRKFESPEGGIYFSILLDLKGIEISKITILTPMAAVAVARSIEKLTNKKVGIKWVNDIFLKDKKICGILTQASLDLETNTIGSCVVGIGIDYKLDIERLPENLKDIVGTIFNKNEVPSVTQNELVANILNELVSMYRNLDDKEFLKEYISHSIVLGKNIEFMLNNEKLEGKALSIDENAALVVECNNGQTIKLNSGEVSIKLFK